jgi:hypothetical protein
MSASDAAAEPVSVAPCVTRIVSTALLVGPVRLMLGAVGLAAARAAGAPAGSAGLAFATAAAGMAIVVLNDPRRRFFERATTEPLPESALFRTRVRAVGRALYPSTLGLAVLVAIALGLDRGVLGALLSGLLAGLGVAALVSGVDVLLRERGSRCEYYTGRGGEIYVRERA